MKTRVSRRAMLEVAGITAALAVGQSAAPEPGIPPLQTEFAFEAIVEIKPVVEVGPSSHGTRRYIPIVGGTFHGPKISGVVLPGGADWQLERTDGVVELDALYSLKTEDGAVIIVHNRGLLSGGSIRTAAQFEAPRGPHDWLNRSVFVGSVAGGSRPGAVLVRFFRVL